MACSVFCNRCFQPPSAAGRFSLTNCGHVFCDACLGKGRRNECLLCRVHCRSVVLSKQTDMDIQALFTRVDGLCTRYSREISQVSEFQEKHRKRLLAFYRETIHRLEHSLKTATLQIQQLQDNRLTQQAPLDLIRSAASIPSAELEGPRLLQLLTPDSVSRGRTDLGTTAHWPADQEELMDVEGPLQQSRKPEVAAGPARISLISPPQDGRMGSVSHQGMVPPSLTPTLASLPKLLRPLTPQLLVQGLPPMPTPQVPGTAGRRETSSPLSLTRIQVQPRPPISISELLQRRCPGSAMLEQ